MSPQLGTTPSATEQRDAVHVALLVVRADVPLRPGEKVRLLRKAKPSGAFLYGNEIPLVTSLNEPPEDALAFGVGEVEAYESVGVIDPWRPELVGPGELTWLLLNPGTVTGLRHHWSHPIIDGKAAGPETTTVDEAEAEMVPLLQGLGVEQGDIEEIIDDLKRGVAPNVHSRSWDIHAESDVDPEDLAKFWELATALRQRETGDAFKAAVTWTCSC